MELRIFGLPVISYRSGVTPPLQEKRSGGTYKNADLFSPYNIGGSGVPAVVSDRSILSVTPVWAAVRYISEAIAALQSGVYKRRMGEYGTVIEPAMSHPVGELFQSRPHPLYNTFDYFASLVASACLNDGYSRIHRDPGTYRPSALELFPSNIVTLVQSSRTGQLYYRVQGTIGVGDSMRMVDEMIPDTDMIHIKGMTVNGVNGEQIRLIHRGTMHSGLSAISYADNFLESGGSVGGIITMPQEATEEQRIQMDTRVIPKMSGAENAGKIAFMDGGIDFKPVQMTPDKAMLVDFHRMSVADIARIFKIPQHKLGEMTNATFSNIEVQSLEWVVDCLTPWVKRIESEFNSKLFNTQETRSGRVFYRFNLNSLMRGDTEARSKYYASMVQNGCMTPNEVRALEQLNPIEGGDQLFIQMNMAPLGRLPEKPDANTNDNAETPATTTDTNTDDNATDNPSPAPAGE